MCLQVFLKGDSTDACTAYPLGIMLIYYLQVVILSSVLFLTTAVNTFLQVIQAIDTIRRQPKQTVTDLDSPECISTLHTLYSMILTAVGRSLWISASLLCACCYLMS